MPSAPPQRSPPCLVTLYDHQATRVGASRLPRVSHTLISLITRSALQLHALWWVLSRDCDTPRARDPLHAVAVQPRQDYPWSVERLPCMGYCRVAPTGQVSALAFRARLGTQAAPHTMAWRNSGSSVKECKWQLGLSAHHAAPRRDRYAPQGHYPARVANLTIVTFMARYNLKER